MTEHAYPARASARRVENARRSRAAHGTAAASRRPNALQAFGLACACVAAGAVVWALASFVSIVHRADARLLYDFTRANRPSVERVGELALHLLDPSLFVLWGIALVAFALSRGRGRVALAVAAILTLAPATSELLKPLLAQPHASVGGVHINSSSWPSGHSTAAMALVLGAVLASPSRLRPFVATLGGAYVALVAVALLVLAWHMPSDVLGGFLVAGTWAALALALLRLTDRSRADGDARAPAG